MTEAITIADEMLAGLEGVTPGPWQEIGGHLTTRSENKHAMTAFGLDEMGQSIHSLQHPYQSVRFARPIDARHIARCSPDRIRILAEAVKAQADRLQSAEAEIAQLRVALERIAVLEKHGGENPRVYPVDIARAALQNHGASTNG